MTFEDYVENCKKTQNLDELGKDDLKNYLAIGLAGEAGEVANVIKKIQFYKRDKATRILLETLLCEEMGDLFYYLVNSCDAFGIDINDVMKLNAKKVDKVYQDFA